MATCWTHEGKCPNEANAVMFAPDGDRVPGRYCEAHAKAACDEYAEKLGEIWSYQIQNVVTSK